MKTVFVVHRQGVYTQGIFGIFTEISQAQEFAKKQAYLEIDAYHSFVIQEIPLGESRRDFVMEHYGNKAIYEYKPNKIGAHEVSVTEIKHD